MVGAWARAGGVLSQEVERGRLDPSAVGLQGCSQTSIPTASPWASWSVVSPGCVLPEPDGRWRRPLAVGSGDPAGPLELLGRATSPSGGCEGGVRGMRWVPSWGDRGRPTFFLGEWSIPGRSSCAPALSPGLCPTCDEMVASFILKTRLITYL